MGTCESVVSGPLSVVKAHTTSHDDLCHGHKGEKERQKFSDGGLVDKERLDP